MDIISFNEAATANGRIEKFIENPDSNSGIVTVPKVIGSGESVTIPAGRVAVLPNVQVDGTLNVEAGGEIFIPAGTTFDKVVELTGDQTIDDIKIFTSSPIVPTPTTGTQVANKQYVDDNDIGVGQTWQDVTASRSSGVTYTNTTGKPIVVAIINADLSAGFFSVGIVKTGRLSGTSTYTTVYAIVPNNSTYYLQGGGSFSSWSELR